MLSGDIAKLFQTKSRIFLWKGRWIRADRFKGGRSKKNWIFEFREGDKLGNVEAKGSSRFILSSNPHEYKPDISLPKGFDFYFLAGFDKLKKLSNLEIPERSHIELTTIHKKQLKKAVVNLTYKAWSIGMDHREAENFFGLKTPQEMLEFLKETDHNAVFIHADGFFMGMWRGNWKKLKNALEIAACDVVSYATSYRLRKRDCSGLKRPNSFKGKWILPDRSIVAIPYIKVENPLKTTGMGDVISSSIVSSLINS